MPWEGFDMERRVGNGWLRACRNGIHLCRPIVKRCIHCESHNFHPMDRPGLLHRLTSREASLTTPSAGTTPQPIIC